MDRDEIKAKLGELAKIDDESAILPKTLLAIMEADEESANRVADMRKEILEHIDNNTTQTNKKIKALMEASENSDNHIATISQEIIQHIADTNNHIEAVNVENLHKNSHNMYISIAILVFVLAIAGFVWFSKYL